MTPTAGECTTPESVLPAKYVGGASRRTFGPFRQFSSANDSVAPEELARRWTQLSPEEILQSPYVLIGTVDKLIEDLHARRERWGISYYVIFEPYADTFAPVVTRLAGG